MSYDSNKYLLKLPYGWYVVTTAVYGQGVATYRFKVGDVIKYRGLSQGGILAPGDDVEIVRLGADPSYYIVKLASLFKSHTWMVKDTDLEPTYTLPHWSQAYSPYPEAASAAVDNSTNSSYDDLIEKRKANGECESCGKVRPMTMFGLGDCSCTPPLPARW